MWRNHEITGICRVLVMQPCYTWHQIGAGVVYTSSNRIPVQQRLLDPAISYLTQPLVTWPSHWLLDPAIGYLTQPLVTWPSHRLLDPAIGYLTQPSSTWNSHSGFILESTETHGQWILYLSHQITKLEFVKQGHWIFRPAGFMTIKI